MAKNGIGGNFAESQWANNFIWILANNQSQKVLRIIYWHKTALQLQVQAPL